MPSRAQMLSTLRDISDWAVRAGVGTNNISIVDARHPSYIFINGNLARMLLAAARVTRRVANFPRIGRDLDAMSVTRSPHLVPASTLWCQLIA